MVEVASNPSPRSATKSSHSSPLAGAPHRERRGLERLLHLAFVRVAGEDRRQHHLDPGPPQLAGREPAHGVFGPEAQNVFVRPQVGDPHPAPPPMRISVPNPALARTCLSLRTSAYGRATAAGWSSIHRLAQHRHRHQVEHAVRRHVGHARRTDRRERAPRLPPAHLLGDRGGKAVRAFGHTLKVDAERTQAVPGGRGRAEDPDGARADGRGHPHRARVAADDDATPPAHRREHGRQVAQRQRRQRPGRATARRRRAPRAHRRRTRGRPAPSPAAASAATA